MLTGSSSYPTVPPSFNLDNFEEVRTLKAGSATVIELPFTAHPLPDIAWTFDDEPVEDKRFQQETIYGMTTLRLKKLTRDDSGDYVVTVSNAHGQATLTVKVIVLGEWFQFWFCFDFCMTEENLFSLNVLLYITHEVSLRKYYLCIVVIC